MLFPAGLFVQVGSVAAPVFAVGVVGTGGAAQGADHSEEPLLGFFGDFHQLRVFVALAGDELGGVGDAHQGLVLGGHLDGDVTGQEQVGAGVALEGQLGQAVIADTKDEIRMEIDAEPVLHGALYIEAGDDTKILCYEGFLHHFQGQAERFGHYDFKWRFIRHPVIPPVDLM
jgi:hypothetical protein